MRPIAHLFTRRKKYTALEPDEIFIDSQNLPSFDKNHLEGRIERSLSQSVYRNVIVACGLLITLFAGQSFILGVWNSDFYASWAKENRLQHDSLLAERGLITDRNGVKLAVNTSSTSEAVTRSYPLGEAAAHLTGYVSYPKRDQNGFWYQDETIGLSGIEALYNDTLRGQNGTVIQETDASGHVVSGSILRVPQAGRDVVLSIDADLQEAIHAMVKERVEASFKGGAAAIMDIETGELYALVSYPSFDPEVMSSGEPRSVVAGYTLDSRSPFVDRAISGLYTPGSIVKPFLAVAALEEGVVTPNTVYVSTGKLVVPNPYDPEKPTIFKDWRAHGAVDMRKAIAVSSDVYFYIVGGGFGKDRGLGISAIDSFAARFGFGRKTGFPLEEEPEGVVPSPAWKTETFNESVWRVGDTYNSSIGQYGWQVTLLQAVRAVASIANNGTLVSPTILKDEKTDAVALNLKPENLQVVREGMRMAVTQGTAQSLSIPGFPVGAKTGTAETGVRKEYTNSLVIGFFPYDKPKYAFAVILERSKAGTLVGAPAVTRDILSWIKEHRPEMTLSTD